MYVCISFLCNRYEISINVFSYGESIETSVSELLILLTFK